MSVPMPVGGYRPTNALVAVAWIGQNVEGVTPSMVATSLPRALETWAALGFVQVTMLSRTADVNGLKRLPVAQVDAWAHSPDSVRPPVAKANGLAELVFAAASDPRPTYDRTLTVKANYRDAYVLGVYPLTEPAEVPDDPAGFARATFDMALDWAPL
jgi:hypothetical protein